MAAPSKLTAEQREQLKLDFASGEYSKKQLSIKYGVSYVYTCFLIRDGASTGRTRTRTVEHFSGSPIVSEIQEKLSELKKQREDIDSKIKHWSAALNGVKSQHKENDDAIKD